MIKTYLNKQFLEEFRDKRREVTLYLAKSTKGKS